MEVKSPNQSNFQQKRRRRKLERRNRLNANAPIHFLYYFGPDYRKDVSESGKYAIYPNVPTDVII